MYSQKKGAPMENLYEFVTFTLEVYTVLVSGASSCSEANGNGKRIFCLHVGLLPSYWVSPGQNSAIMLEGSERIGSATYFVDAHQPPPVQAMSQG